MLHGVSGGNASVRIVVDTNTVISGLLWSGPPQQIINTARAKRITLFDINPVVAGDPDDDQVLACALAARAELIISGDKGLRNLKTYQSIPIVGAAAALERIAHR